MSALLPSTSALQADAAIGEHRGIHSCIVVKV